MRTRSYTEQNEETDTPSVVGGDADTERMRCEAAPAPRTLVVESVRRINKSHNEMGEQNSTSVVSHIWTKPQPPTTVHTVRQKNQLLVSSVTRKSNF